MGEIIDYIGWYADETLKPASRFSSWQPCYEHFGRQGVTSDRQTILELGFYLASWGMYRGRGFLLQRNVTVHEGVAEIVQRPKYRGLHGYAPSHPDKADIDLILSLYQEIHEHYKTWSVTVRNKEGNPQNTSETLVTKVMLGTTGCIPAFDRYVKLAMKDIDGLPCTSKDSDICSTIKSLWKYYSDNIHEFEAVSEMLRTEGHPDYPPMKLLDMYLWTKGKMLKQESESP
jgi:hypothetical protein